MSMIRSRRWAVCAVLAGLGMGEAAARVPDLQRGAEFRFGGPFSGLRWRVTQPLVDRLAPPAGRWLRAGAAGSEREAWIGDRVAVRLRPGATLPESQLGRLGLSGTGARPVGSRGRVWVLSARDAWGAASAAVGLLALPGVEAAAPVMRTHRALHGGFAARPDDPYFGLQWHLENRDAEGARRGPDLNPRSAWAVTLGEGVTIGIADEGFETDHPDLRANAAGAPHYDFVGGASNAVVYGDHATLVAGLAGARGDNGVGVSGLAPRVRLASWTLFDSRSGFAFAADEEGFAAMFGHRNQDVWVQNHSWGAGDERLFGPSFIEEEALREAWENGRGGRGVVMVRSGGNNRANAGDANGDGFANDPRVVAVAGVRQDGRAASYSNSGACLLVSAPTSDDEDTFLPTAGICTTDRVGSRGWNSTFRTDDFASYATNFNGTSASAPQISGIVALMLAANPELGIRDVQQVLAHAAWQPDLADPFVQTNGAGYRVSHNQGFGIVDAGQAVRWAAAWSNRPPVTIVRSSRADLLSVPDDGLRVWVRGAEGSERSLACLPSRGVHPDSPTAALPLVFVGLATNDVTQDLRGKAALVERGVSFFREKIDRVARAGAAFCVIFNHVDGTGLLTPGGTDFAPIPAVLIGQNDGRALVARLSSGEAVTAQVRLQAVAHAFAITNRMICEHVGLRVRASHPRRADLRIVLQSPAGTRSILQALGTDAEAAPDDWTYWSIQHFYEGSAGTWTATFGDEQAGRTGSILESELVIRGLPVEDADGDGLDDTWETRWFGGLGAGPREDPDGDGEWNAREQVLGTDPTRATEPFRVEVASFDDAGRLRLSWPARENVEYRVLRTGTIERQPEALLNVPGRFPEQEAILSPGSEAAMFFRVEETRPTDGR
jgi:subtilisin family serine protease